MERRREGGSAGLVLLHAAVCRTKDALDEGVVLHLDGDRPPDHRLKQCVQREKLLILRRFLPFSPSGLSRSLLGVRRLHALVILLWEAHERELEFLFT
jgi:hypothetical protein